MIGKYIYKWNTIKKGIIKYLIIDIKNNTFYLYDNSNILLVNIEDINIYYDVDLTTAILKNIDIKFYQIYILDHERKYLTKNQKNKKLYKFKKKFK